MAGAAKTSSPWIDSVPDVTRFPSLKGDVECDVVVVGGGISGVMSAYHLARKGLSVVLLEKNRVASGDTGFTTGFLLRAPDTSIAKLAELYGEPFVRDIFEAAGSAQDTVRELVSRGKIDCGFSDCSAYYCAYRKGDQALATEWAAISKADKRASFLRGKELSGLGVGIAEAIKFSGEAQFNPRKFIFGLLAMPESKGIRVFEDSEVLDVTVGDKVVAATAGGRAVCGRIVVCSGLPIAAFSELRAVFEPKVTYALAARFEKKAPISADLFWDTYDPYFYYRRLDERTVIIGGADRRPGQKATPEEQKPHDKLRSFVADRMSGKFEVTNEWSGTLYESPDGLPFASEHPHYRGKVFVGSCCGFGGNGLVLGTLAGSVLADLVAGGENRYAKLLSFSRTSIEIPAPRPKAAAGLKSKITVKIKDVEEGSPYCADAGGRKVAVFKAGDGFYAIDDTCTHAGGSLSEGTQEGGVVTCPMHGAKFDIKSGAVLGPPATRPVRSYQAKAVGEDVEIETGAEAAQRPMEAGTVSRKEAGAAAGGAAPAAAGPPPKPAGPRLFDGVRKNPWYVIKASAIALAFWLVQFVYMYFSAVPGQLERAIILASSYSGATLIGIALMLGPISVLFPRYNQVQHRRTFGVWGFTFIIAHVVWVFIYYQFTLQSFLSNLDPFTNAIIFGAIAFTCYVPMYLTSTDWAVAKLGFKRWKTIHRIVYLAFLFSTLHFIRIVSLNANPLIWNYSKALLMAVAGVAYALELAAYAKYMRKKRTWGNTLYGGALIIFGLIMMYLAFQP